MKRRFLLLSTLLVLLLSSCGTQQEKAEYYTGILEQDALEREHLNLVLTEDVIVDADIPSYEAYQNGMTSYYLAKIPQTGEDFSQKGYEEAPVAFNQSIRDLCDKTVQENGGSFSYGEMEIVWEDIGAVVVIPYTNDAGNPVEFYTTAYYSNGKQGLEAPGLSFTKGNFQYLSYFGMLLPQINPDYEIKDLDFEAAERCGERIRLYLQDISGREISSDYDIIPIDKEEFLELEAEIGTTAESAYEGDYYTFKYRYEIDGFQWENLSLVQVLSGKEELSEEVENQHIRLESTNYLRTFDDWNQIVCVSEEGIVYMVLNSYADISDVYREKAEIVPLEYILSQVQGYFEEMLLLNPVEIYDIMLVYSSSFSYVEDGPLRNVVRPFWIVKYDDNSGGYAQQLVYDAYTGEFQTVQNAT